MVKRKIKYPRIKVFSSKLKPNVLRCKIITQHLIMLTKITTLSSNDQIVRAVYNDNHHAMFNHCPARSQRRCFHKVNFRLCPRDKKFSRQV